MSVRDAILEQVPGWDQERVRNARVLVVGAGALGNEVLKNLALLNVRRLVIADFDRVEASNLSRSVLFRPADAEAGLPKAEVAAQRLLEINPELEILTLKGDCMSDLGLGLLRNVDVAIGCVDNRLARLYLNRLCFRAGIPWVNGGILNLSGQVSSYQLGTACYECGLTAVGWKDIRARMGCTDMARRYAMSGQMPTTPLAASLVGAVQVQEALKLVCGGNSENLLGKMFSWEGEFNRSAVYESLPPRELCDSHLLCTPVVGATNLSAESTLGEVFAAMHKEFGAMQPVLHLDHSVATEVATMLSKKRFPMVIPQIHLSDRVADTVREIAGEGVGIPKGKLLDRIAPDMGLNHLRLTDLGVPFWHIIQIRSGKKRWWIELEADAAAVEFAPGHKVVPNPWFEYNPAGIIGDIKL